MNYEKLYKESLEKAKAFAAKYVGDGLLISSEGSVAKEFNEIFQELRESEDERISKELIEFIRTLPCTIPVKKEYFDWIEKQGKQKPVEWSEEDEKMIDKIIYNLEFPTGVTAFKKPIEEMVSWLKSFKPQPKQEWSEEDESHFKSIISTIEYCKNEYPNATICVEAYNSDLNWLKSIKSQSHWKPTKEQMEIIGNLLTCDMPPRHKKILTELYNDLQKL